MPIPSDFFYCRTGSSAHGVFRRYEIVCRSCKNKGRYEILHNDEYFPGMVPPWLGDKLRNYFTKANWLVGTARENHYCPKCRRHHDSAAGQSSAIQAVRSGEVRVLPVIVAPPTAAPPPRLISIAAPPFLVTAWDDATDAERMELVPKTIAWARERGYQRDLIEWATVSQMPAAVDADSAALGAMLQAWDRCTPIARERFMARTGTTPAGKAPPRIRAVTETADPNVIRKSDLARELGVAACTVSGFILRGMPTRDDGRLDADVCRAWVAENRYAKPRKHVWTPSDADDAPSVGAISLDDDEAIARLSAKLNLS